MSDASGAPRGGAPRPRVLFVIPNLDFGGAQRSLSKITHELAKTCEVTLVAFNGDAACDYSYGVPIETLDVPGGKNVVDKARRFAERVAKLRALKRRFRPDVCISFLEGADYVNVLSRRDERVVLSIRGSKLHDREIRGALGRLRLRVLIPILYRGADDIVAVSDAVRRELVEELGLPASKCLAIPNFYDVDAMRRHAEAPMDGDDAAVLRDRVIVNHGRLHESKNLEGLIDAFAATRCRGRGWKLVLVGDGPLRASLVARARGHGLRTFDFAEGGSVREDHELVILGYRANPFPYLRAASVFAFSSSWEGFPNALCEAMAVGLPILAADCPPGSVRDILAPSGTSAASRRADRTGAGSLLPLLEGTEAIRAWAEELDAFATDGELRREHGLRAAARVGEFSTSNAMARWTSLVDRKKRASHVE